MNTPTHTLIPSSRRYTKNQSHPYGWQVSFHQTVRFPDGHTERKFFSALGTTRSAAIGNAIARPVYPTKA